MWLKAFKLNFGSWAGWFSSSDTQLHHVLDKLDYLGCTQALTDGASIAWNTASGAFATVTLEGNRALAAPSNLKRGCLYGIAVTQDATGSRTLSWASVYDFGKIKSPVLTTTAAATDTFLFYYDGATLRNIDLGKQADWQSENTLTKSDNYTVQALDSGYVIDVDTDAKTITLPATAVGLTITIRNAGATDGAVALNVSPNASDKIVGLGDAGTDNKDLINTKATAKVGDFVTLVADGSAGWYVTASRGIFAREA